MEEKLRSIIISFGGSLALALMRAIILSFRPLLVELGADCERRNIFQAFQVNSPVSGKIASATEFSDFLSR